MRSLGYSSVCWYGHALRKENGNVLRMALEFEVEWEAEWNMENAGDRGTHEGRIDREDSYIFGVNRFATGVDMNPVSHTALLGTLPDCEDTVPSLSLHPPCLCRAPSSLWTMLAAPLEVSTMHVRCLL